MTETLATALRLSQCHKMRHLKRQPCKAESTLFRPRSEYLRERLADKDKNLDDLRTTIRLLEYKKEPQPAPVGFWKRLFGKTKRPEHE